MHGSWEGLRGAIRRLDEIATGKAAKRVAATIGKAALEEARRTFSARQAPDGSAWKGGADLVQSGRLRNSLKLEDRLGGFAIVVSGVHSAHGGYYGGTQLYGRTIRARGSKPLRWKGMNGEWRSAWKLRVPARPFLPIRGRTPTAWLAALERAARGTRLA